jgi:UDP-N-acetylglucosamine acyltransferase
LSIHPTAIVSAEAEIAPSAQIGPFCVIEGRVEIGERTVVEPSAHIGSRFGRVRLGTDNLVQRGAVLGGPAQDYSYQDADAALEIGHHNRFGDYCTVNLGTQKADGVTRIGNYNFLMAYVHIGHDCCLEDHVVITNATQLAGHVTVERHALLSGHGGITQFCRIGAYSFLTAAFYANKDIPPYTIASGHWAVPRAVNKVGLRRAGFGAAARRNVETAIRLLLDVSLTIDDAVAAIESQCRRDELVEHLLKFISSSERGIARA